MSFFFSNSKSLKSENNFDYLEKNDYYFDSACQTLRPQEVINKEVEYYQKYNSCGHRVKYKWGKQVDQNVDECRNQLLKLVKKDAKHYTVAFTLNTTFGINQILQQIRAYEYNSIITSEIEHNSVFLPSLTFAKKHNLPRFVFPRNENPESKEYGSLVYNKEQLEKSIVILNTTSNIHGQELSNLSQLARDVHENQGLILLDACQTINHNPELLENVEFDACFGSGHKMYGPSVGFIIVKKSLLENLDYFLIGGSTVTDVKLDEFELISGSEDYSKIEPGLQNYAGITALAEALNWKKSFKKDGLNAHKYEIMLSQKLNDELKQISDIKLLNPHTSPIVSIYSPKIDSHKLGMYLSEKNIMCRTGYHCCHYYLKEKLKLPPLLRISLGLHNTNQDIDFLITQLKFILKNY